MDEASSSEKIVDCLGLDGGSVVASRTGEELPEHNIGFATSAVSVSNVSGGVSTRLRFVGGSSSYSGRFFCRE